MPAKMLSFKTCCSRVDRLAYNLLALKTWKGYEKKPSLRGPPPKSPHSPPQKGQKEMRRKTNSGVGNV